MNKTLTLLIAATALTAGLSGCSLWKKTNAHTADTGDAMPLYPVATASKQASSLNGHWYIRTVGTITLDGIEDEDWPYIDFVDTEARFYGSDGCNVINGSYRIGSGQTLQLSKVASTMRLCENDTLSYPISRALNSTASYSISTQADGRQILSLHNADNLTVMTLGKNDLDFLNGAWQVVGIGGKEVNVEAARLIFDIPEGKIRGNAGCNRLMGDISHNPQVTGSVQLSGLNTTRMTCPDIATESALLIALEEVVSAKITGKNNVGLLNSDGKVIVKLKKLQRSDF